MCPPSDLKIWQHCDSDERDAREDEVKEARDDYEFFARFPEGYPRFVEAVPRREWSARDWKLLIASAVKMAESQAAQSKRHSWYKLLTPDEDELPFEDYKSLYDEKKLPEIGKGRRWQLDADFAAQRMSGMYPWFLRRVKDFDEFNEDFGISNEDLEAILPRHLTIEILKNEKRLYYVDQPALKEAQPEHGHEMTAPTTLFYVTNLGGLLPLGIKLNAKGATNNPVMTPNQDKFLWLAAKIHAGCADTLVHSIYSHAVLLHLVMSAVWIAANRALPESHPVHAFLKPHFDGTLFVTHHVINSMDADGGQQSDVYGTGIDGQNTFVKELYENHFSFKEFNPRVDFDNREITSDIELKKFHYRDDALILWDADRAYVKQMLEQFYSSDEDVELDKELQDWANELASTEGADLKGLPLATDGRFKTVDELIEVITCVLFSVTSRHSAIENGALDYLYIPANPFLYKLEAPEDRTVEMTAEEVAAELPPIKSAIKGYSLIASADFDHEDYDRIGEYPSDFTDGWPDGTKAIIENWREALADIEAEIVARNDRLQFGYTSLMPSRTYNSIWN